MRTPSVEDSTALKVLPFVLSVIAGSTDVIGFLGLNGLFTAHITGNLVILAAKLVIGEQAPIAALISVPVFMAALALTKLLAAQFERIQIASLLPLLLLQFLLLLGFLSLGFVAGPHGDPNAAIMVVAGMLGVCAMAVQNALVRLSLRGAPTTAVMTTNVTVFAIDAMEMLVGREARSIAAARERAGHTWPAILGFLLGCVLGAACEAALGLNSLVLPTGLALLGTVLGLATVARSRVSENSDN